MPGGYPNGGEWRFEVGGSDAVGARDGRIFLTAVLFHCKRWRAHSRASTVPISTVFGSI
jgi:hypothetical protein